MTDTHESDEQFVERMRDRVTSGDFRYVLTVASVKDQDRLLSLALRGAAVRWRPISEAPKDGTELLGKLSNGWCTTMSHRAEPGDRYSWWSTPRCVSIPVVETHPEDTDWGHGLLATHFIPLTALGDPND